MDLNEPTVSALLRRVKRPGRGGDLLRAAPGVLRCGSGGRMCRPGAVGGRSRRLQTADRVLLHRDAAARADGGAVGQRTIEGAAPRCQRHENEKTEPAAHRDSSECLSA